MQGGKGGGKRLQTNGSTLGGFSFEHLAQSRDSDSFVNFLRGSTRINSPQSISPKYGGELSCCSTGVSGSWNMVIYVSEPYLSFVAAPQCTNRGYNHRPRQTDMSGYTFCASCCSVSSKGYFLNAGTTLVLVHISNSRL